MINNNNDWFYIATYHPHGGSQTALQSIITPADQLIPYIEMLSLHTFTSKCFQRSLTLTSSRHFQYFENKFG